MGDQLAIMPVSQAPIQIQLGPGEVLILVTVPVLGKVLLQAGAKARQLFLVVLVVAGLPVVFGQDVELLSGIGTDQDARVSRHGRPDEAVDTLAIDGRREEPNQHEESGNERRDTKRGGRHVVLVLLPTGGLDCLSAVDGNGSVGRLGNVTLLARDAALARCESLGCLLGIVVRFGQMKECAAPVWLKEWTTTRGSAKHLWCESERGGDKCWERRRKKMSRNRACGAA